MNSNSADVGRDNPAWYQLKDPMDHNEGNSPGMILADVRLLFGEKGRVPRPNLKIYDVAKINIYCYIYACYELEPELESEEVQARIEINFGKLHSSQKVI